MLASLWAATLGKGILRLFTLLQGGVQRALHQLIMYTPKCTLSSCSDHWYGFQPYYICSGLYKKHPEAQTIPKQFEHLKKKEKGEKITTIKRTCPLREKEKVHGIGSREYFQNTNLSLAHTRAQKKKKNHDIAALES